MLDQIEALVALEQYGTMSEAAVRLRITQSAVSKRLALLQRALGVALLERDGRRTSLTPAALDLLERARPLVAELRSLAALEPKKPGPARFTLAIADSIASSWGPRVVRKALDLCPKVQVELHAHRSVLIVESVRLGRYQLGLSTELAGVKDLVHHPIAEERFALVYGTNEETAPLITIEPTSATWRAIEPQLKVHHPRFFDRRMIPVETFTAALQMVRAGFGDGLVPLGMVEEAQLSKRTYRTLPRVVRKLALLARKQAHQRPELLTFAEALAEAARVQLSR